MRCLLITFVSLLAAGSVSAQGVSVHSHSACAVARVSAGVANPCVDGSAIFYNPAAIVRARGVASVGVLPISISSTFTFDTASVGVDGTQPIKPIPHMWVTAALSPKITAGLGVWAPYGLSTAWPAGFEGRFTGFDNTLRGIYIQPTIATSFLQERLALGAGVVVVNGSVDLQRRLDLAGRSLLTPRLTNTIIPGTRGTLAGFSVPEGTDFANAELQVSDWTVTYHVGAQFKASDRWWLGARYLHSAQLDLTGKAHFRQVATGLRLPPNNPFGLPAGTPVDLVLARLFQPGGVLAAQRLATSLTLPSQVVLGASYAIDSAVELVFDYQWTHWNVFDEAVLNFGIAPNDTLFLDFHDASTFRVAAQYVPRSAVTVRGGVSYNGHASADLSVSPLLAEADRVAFSGGLGYRFTERFSGDAGVELTLQNDRRGSVRPRTSRQQTTADLNVGVYSGHAVFGGITLSYRFGKRIEQPAADH